MIHLLRPERPGLPWLVRLRVRGVARGLCGVEVESAHVTGDRAHAVPDEVQDVRAHMVDLGDELAQGGAVDHLGVQ